jgi:hypothetical protein
MLAHNVLSLTIVVTLETSSPGFTNYNFFLDPNNQAKTNPRLAHHGAGICLHLQNCATFGVNVGVHIPAPWASHRLELQAVG